MFKRWRFYRAIQREDLEGLTELLKKEPGLARMASAEYHGGPVGRAAECGNKKILQAILEAGADTRSPEARSVLDTAANTDNREVVKLLLEHGAEVNYVDSSGTPLHRAADWCYHGMVQLLLENGADVNARDFQGRTPLDKALASGSKEPTANNSKTIEVLKSHGGISTTPPAPAPSVGASTVPKEKCRHHFIWITRLGAKCEVCRQPISAELVSEERGKYCDFCGFAIHVNCQ